MSDITRTSKERLAALRKRFDESHRDWRMGQTEELFGIAEALAEPSDVEYLAQCLVDQENVLNACEKLLKESLDENGVNVDFVTRLERYWEQSKALGDWRSRNLRLSHEPPAAPKEWRCFHCDEVCTDHASALEHFGIDRHCDPICKVDRAEYRRMEKRNIEHTLEDTELHRALEAKSAEMITAVRKAEEEGYNKGLADGRGLAQPPSPALRDVAAERERQKSIEGWTPEHDDEHSNGELARAAACYALEHQGWRGFSHSWPWSPEWWKPRDRRRNLVRAGALILAEIERMDRATSTKGARCVCGTYELDPGAVHLRDSRGGMHYQTNPCTAPGERDEH